ncbi:MAG: hypothetical protein U1C49_00035 [Candidatus Andersenbacteria bacterium]|nr:hypothetical protein [Candidatus Andersenbacteria bacterium]
MTIEIALIYISQTLERVSDAPRLDAERLLLCVVGKQESSWLYAHSEQELTEKQKNQMSRLVARRQSGEPLAYILGHQEFYGRDFIVTKDVLIPRSATEDLIDRALEVIEDMTREKKRPLVIADIGTGSGCIVVTLLLESSPVAKAMGDKGIKGGGYRYFSGGASGGAAECRALQRGGYD